MKQTSTILKDQLMGLLKKYNLEEPFSEYEIKQNWSEIMPKQLAAVTEPGNVENGVLTIHIKNEHWKKEIVQRKKEVLEMVLSAVKGITIKDIHIV